MTSCICGVGLSRLRAPWAVLALAGILFGGLHARQWDQQTLSRDAHLLQPADWSEELAAIDLEVRRIGWDRDREKVYLERAFGHASRHRLTRYSDLVGFLRQLRAMQPGESPETAAVPLRRSDLLSQGDEMIRTMGWSSAQARECLQKELGATSRQQLSDQQLMQFNMILENLTTTANE